MGVTAPHARISGMGIGVPDRVVTNADLEKFVDTTDEWIQTRTGIKERRLIEDGLTNSDICVKAANQAMEEAGITAMDLDVIIVATVTPDVKFPSTACYLQAKIGAENAAAFDLGAACSGFVYALSVADGMMHNPEYRNILVVGSDILSSVTDWSDRSTCVLFGDAAGACIISKSDGSSGILSTYIQSDGRLANVLNAPAGGVSMPITPEVLESKQQYVQMNGREVFRHAVRTMSTASHRVLEDCGLTYNDIALLIPHQANKRIIQAIARDLELPDDRVYINLERYGNTAAATIPVAMKEAKDLGLLKPGDYCLLVVAGGGFTWGASIIKM
jgi:3-oxoacyl-[acyl-carrier-protein] synthase III